MTHSSGGYEISFRARRPRSSITRRGAQSHLTLADDMYIGTQISCRRSQLSTRLSLRRQRRRWRDDLSHPLQRTRQVRLQSPASIACTIVTTYRAHAVRDWMSNHPRIALPIIVALLGTLSYLVFDPIRAFSVRSKVEGFFDPHRYRSLQWLRAETLDRCASTTLGLG